MSGDEMVKGLGDAIAGMTVKQAAGLAEYLKRAYGIEAPTGATVVEPFTTLGSFTIPDDGLPATVDVVLVEAGTKKISVIKVVRAATGLGLKEAKDLVEGAPRVVKAAVDRAEAEKLRAELEREGAKVELR
jgi:large subunit ribosomal protein L7/L12